MGEDTSGKTGQLLDLASLRRQEKQVVDVGVEQTLLVVFSLHPPAGSPQTDSDLFSLPASAVESIVPVEQITYLPGTPPWILGVVNVRGEIESVLDLKVVLGLGEAEITTNSRLLICQDEDLRSGILVDRVVDIIHISSSAISPPPTPIEGGKGVYVEGETDYDDQPLVILGLSQIFRRALETDRV